MVKMKKGIQWKTPKEIEINRPSWGDSAPDGLVPVGNSGIYITPDEPANPRDCDRVPDSPWCGGNPFDVKPIGIGIEPEIDECGFKVTATGTLGFTKVPPIAIAWRKPGPCREREKPDRPDIDTSDIPKTEGNQELSSGFNQPISFNEIVYAGIGYTFASTFPIAQFGDVPLAEFVLGTSIDYDYKKYRYSGSDYISEIVASYKITSVGFTPNYQTGELEKNRGESSYWQFWKYPHFHQVEWRINVNKMEVYQIYKYGNKINEYPENAGGPYESIYLDGQVTGFENFENPIASTGTNTNLVYGRWGLIKDYFTKNRETITEDSAYTYFEYVCYGVLKAGGKPFDYAQDLDSGKRKCCMNCCQDSANQRNQQDEDNRQLLKLIKEMHKVLAPGEFPSFLPSSLITKDEGFIGSLIPNLPTIISNYPKLFEWFIKAFEEIFGEWEIPIEIKDVDPTTPGEQPKGIRLRNMAEAFAELTAMHITSTSNTEILVNMLTRTMSEVGSNKILSVTSESKIQALIDFFGFTAEEKLKNIPYTFTPDKEKIDEILQESTQKIATFYLKDKKNTYKNDIAKLIEAAAIIKAVHFRKLGSNDPATAVSNMMDIIKKMSGTNDKVDAALAKKDVEQLDKAIADFESGYIQYTGIDNVTQPYGEPFNNRPRVIRLNNQTDIGST